RFASTTIAVNVRRRGDWMTMTVADDGPGFPERVLAQPFDRFVRADPTRAGTGLGLAIVASTARAAGGDVALGNGEALGGAWVTITLPATAPDTGSH
ncbi:MAG: HAMP domain-containing sensor histidine kinase, partial [Acidimicrobiales bacterium]|nr:HAMP domain-containing sensor histidine kinase [Acidimicrobiales bacterium]